MWNEIKIVVPSLRLEVIENFPFSKPEDLTTHSTECGANNYFYDNRTIHFVVTNVPDCQVAVKLINSVQINFRIAMTVDDFLNNDTNTNFVDRITAFLNIPTDKLKIVGIKETTAARR